MNKNYDEINRLNVSIIKSSTDEYEINKAIEALYENNKGIIISLLNKYQYFIKDRNYVDNEAYFILWDCARNYNEKKNSAFSTYFCETYKNTIYSIILKTNHDLPSPHIRAKIRLIDDYIASYSLENEKEPSIDEIASHLKTSTTKVEEYLFYRLMMMNKVTQDELDIIDTTSIEKEIIKEYESKRFKEVFNRLSDKEKDILERRYGLNGKAEEDYKTIAKRYNQSDENIRIIHNNTIIKLRKILLGGMKNEK